MQRYCVGHFATIANAKALNQLNKQYFIILSRLSRIGLKFQSSFLARTPIAACLKSSASRRLSQPSKNGLKSRTGCFYKSLCKIYMIQELFQEKLEAYFSGIVQKERESFKNIQECETVQRTLGLLSKSRFKKRQLESRRGQASDEARFSEQWIQKMG